MLNSVNGKCQLTRMLATMYYECHILFLSLFLSFLVLPLCSCESTPKYEIIDLLGQKDGAVYTINNHGEVSGISSNKLFLYDSMTKDYLWGPEVSPYCYLVQISDQRDVLVGATKDEQNNHSLLMWNPGQGTTSIPFDEKDIEVKSFNNNHQALLWLWTGESTWTGHYWAGNYTSVIWDAKNQKSIYDDPNNLLYAMNDFGNTIGCSKEPDVFKNLFFMNNGSKMKIENIRKKHIVPRDLNNKGQMTGWITNENPESRNDESAFLWDNDRGFTYLGRIMDGHTILNGSLTKGYSVNNKGQVVGWSSRGTVPGPLFWPIQFRDSGRAFYWDKKNGMKDLNDMVANKADGYCLVEALDINDKGQIVGWGIKNGSDRKRPFLLNPIEETSTTKNGDRLEK